MHGSAADCEGTADSEVAVPVERAHIQSLRQHSDEVAMSATTDRRVCGKLVLTVPRHTAGQVTAERNLTAE